MTFYDYVKQQIKEDPEYEEHIRKIELQRELREKEARRTEQLEGTLFLFEEDKHEWISKKYKMPSYENKAVSVEKIVKDIKLIDNDSISFFIVCDAKIDVVNNNLVEYEKYIHFENCEFTFIDDEKIATFQLRVDKYFFTETTIFKFIVKDNPDFYYTPTQIELTFKDSLFNSIDEIEDYQILLHTHEETKYLDIGENYKNVQNIKLLQWMLKYFDEEEKVKVDYMLDEYFDIRLLRSSQ